MRVNCWMECTVHILRLFEVCQDERVIEHMKYTKLDVNRLAKYMRVFIKVL